MTGSPDGVVRLNNSAAHMGGVSTVTSSRGRNGDHLRAWAKRQKNRPLSTSQAEALDSVYPEWRKSYDGAWLEKLEAVAGFVKEHGFFPRPSADDADELALCSWVATQRYRATQMSAARIKMLDERLAGWNDVSGRWNERFNEACRVVASLGRLPRIRDEDKTLERVAGWLHRQRALPDTDWRTVLLNERLPGWNSNRKDNNEAKWNERLAYVVDFNTAHGHLPRETSMDPVEAFHGRWIGEQKRNPEDLPAHRQDILDARVPDWRVKGQSHSGIEARWAAMLEFVDAFMVENGRLPSSRARAPQEAKAGQWVLKQRQGQGLTAARRQALEERLPLVLKPRDEKWMDILHAVAAFYAVNKRLPRMGTEDANETKLRSWYQRAKTTKVPERIEALNTHLPFWRT